MTTLQEEAATKNVVKLDTAALPFPARLSLLLSQETANLNEITSRVSASVGALAEHYGLPTDVEPFIESDYDHVEVAPSVASDVEPEPPGVHKLRWLFVLMMWLPIAMTVAKLAGCGMAAAVFPPLVFGTALVRPLTISAVQLVAVAFSYDFFVETPNYTLTWPTMNDAVLIVLCVAMIGMAKWLKPFLKVVLKDA